MPTPLLLPLRIETRFLPLGGPPERLLVRVIPDEPWFDDHDPAAGEDELAELRTWQRATVDADADPTASAEARRDAAWQRLVKRRGAARARWLAETFPEGTDSPSADQRGRTRTIRGLPPRLEVWLLRDIAGDGVSHGESGPRLVLEPTADAAVLDLPDAPLDEPAGARWWNSYAAAKDVGLAGEISLTDEDLGRAPFAALVVVGAGTTPARELFQAHRDAGRLGVLACGQPTNTVAGATTPVAEDEPTDPVPPANAASVRHLGRLLVGGADGLRRIPAPAAAVYHDALQEAAITGLWPALWGHNLGNLWLTGDGMHEVFPWASRGLRPEGLLPPIRIDEQPYGILPTTPLRLLAASSAWDEPDLLGRHLLPRLLRAREVWLSAASEDGTVRGADVDKVLDLAGRVPVSTSVGWRKLVPHDIGLLIRLAEGEDITPAAHREWWESVNEEVTTFGLLPWRPMSAVLGLRTADVPMVVPRGSDLASVVAGLRALVGLLDPPDAWEAGRFADAGALAADMGGDASVLLTLARASLQLALAEDGRVRSGAPGPTVDDLFRSRLEEWIPSASPDRTTAQSRTALAVRDGIESLATVADDNPELALDRVLQGALDTASHRLDVWLSAPATQRLAKRLEEDTDVRLGAYGWVDDLSFGGGGPTDGGALLAPSQHHAATAAVLRDRHVRSAAAGSDIWQMSIDSTTALEATRLADVVRNGLHPAIALGLEVERIVDDPLRIADLRRRYPARHSDDGRRVCDGLRLAAELTGGDAAVLDLWDDPEGQEITGRLRLALRSKLDGYSDLLVADAVHLVVGGRGSVAGAPLDAAAGLGPPPSLEVLDSPVPGRHLTTVAFCAVAPVALPPDPSPAQIVDPTVAASLDGRFDAGWSWSFEVTGPGVTDEVDLSLADIGLSPSDAATHSAQALTDLAGAEAVTRTARATETAPGQLRRRLLRSTAESTHSAMLRFVASLGSRPLALTDLSGGASDYSPDPAATDHLRSVGLDLVERIVAAARQARRLADDASLGLDDTVRHRARQMGVAAAAGGSGPDIVSEMARRLRAVDDALVRPLASLGETAEEPLPVPESVADWDPADISPEIMARLLKAVRLQDLTEALTRLVAPEGRLTALVTWTVGATSALANLRPPMDPETLRDWLTTVAAVRPALADVEAELIDMEVLDAERTAAGEAPVWLATDPNDPWQLGPAQRRDERNEAAVNVPPLLIGTAHAGVTLETGDRVAVGLVDHFSEVVPDDRRPPSMAFGFDAPGARAPQAFLAVVPPTAGREWSPTGADLVDCVLDARASARVRTVLPEHPRISALAGLLPTAVVPLNGAAAATLAEE